MKYKKNIACAFVLLLCFLAGCATTSSSDSVSVNEAKLIGTWVGRSKRGANRVIMRFDGDGTRVVEYPRRNEPTKNKWEFDGDFLTIKSKINFKSFGNNINFKRDPKREIAIVFEENRVMKPQGGNDAQFYEREGWTYYKYSSSFEYTGNPFEWLSDKRNWPNIIDERYVSKYNPQGVPPKENGHVYDIRFRKHRPDFEYCSQEAFEWAAIEVAKYLFARKFLDEIIDLQYDPNVGAEQLMAAAFLALMDQQLRQSIDVTVAAAYEGCLTKNEVEHIRNFILSREQWRISLEKISEKTFKKSLVDWRKANDYDIRGTKTIYFLHSVLKNYEKLSK